MRKFARSEMKTIRFETDAYLRNSIGLPTVLEKVKPFNYNEETLADGQKIYIEAERFYPETVPKKGRKINFGSTLKNRAAVRPRTTEVPHLLYKKWGSTL